jgi:hypothetical protein
MAQLIRYLSHSLTLKYGARGSEVVEALCCMTEGRGFETTRGYWILPICLILPAELSPWGLFSLQLK